MNKTIRNVLIAVLISVIFLLIFLSLTDIDQAIKSLENAKIKYLLLCLLISIGIWFFEALTLKIISNMQKEKLSFFYLFRITVLGTFFSAITPFAAGGHPVQIIYMQKKRNQNFKGHSDHYFKIHNLSNSYYNNRRCSGHFCVSSYEK